MVSATVNDMVLATVTGTDAGPGVEHVQVLGTDGARKVALTIAIKLVTNPGGPTLELLVDIQGSTDLANWHPVTGGSTSFTLSASYTNPDSIEGVAIDGWPWVRVRYYLKSSDYTAVRSVLLTAVLSAAG
jgi:hypothetical protein